MSRVPTETRNASQRAKAAFLETYDHWPDVEARAPGRVNLIGDHTDYNAGFAMPMALQFDTVIVASPRSDSRVAVHSEGFGSATFDTDDDPFNSRGWSRYLHAMISLAGGVGPAGPGWNGRLASDIPIGAGLSTSAALEMATGLLTGLLTDRSIAKLDLAKFGQRVENQYFGLPSGVMDQLASCSSVAGHATLIDCRDLSMTAVPIPADSAIVVMDTGTRRQLLQSEYADRKSECETAAKALGVQTLREIDFVHQLGKLRTSSRLWRRAHHVVSENKRTVEAAAAMRSDDARAVGQLMSNSHTSLRDDYEVSSPALDLMVEIASETHGCLGARMTGGGFAGCAVALVQLDRSARFCDEVTARFEAAASQDRAAAVRLFIVEASSGASVRRLS